MCLPHVGLLSNATIGIDLTACKSAVPPPPTAAAAGSWAALLVRVPVLDQVSAVATFHHIRHAHACCADRSDLAETASSCRTRTPLIAATSAFRLLLQFRTHPNSVLTTHRSCGQHPIATSKFLHPLDQQSATFNLALIPIVRVVGTILIYREPSDHSTMTTPRFVNAVRRTRLHLRGMTTGAPPH